MRPSKSMKATRSIDVSCSVPVTYIPTTYCSSAQRHSHRHLVHKAVDDCDFRAIISAAESSISFRRPVCERRLNRETNRRPARGSQPADTTQTGKQLRTIALTAVAYYTCHASHSLHPLSISAHLRTCPAVSTTTPQLGKRDKTEDARQSYEPLSSTRIVACDSISLHRYFRSLHHHERAHDPRRRLISARALRRSSHS
ncbi:hypothetical protein HII31_05647 [Pseudocercospora fuligena]|uniref:Uncharacterized protein n=1 Tax=Pseudocercospora fuligena TaxID=685502 RepID=A0A8H6VJR8_9PEZI|nr:hypothetical protein HII31_05647 [Pseudocercospora fuligena]